MHRKYYHHIRMKENVFRYKEGGTNINGMLQLAYSTYQYILSLSEIINSKF